MKTHYHLNSYAPHYEIIYWIEYIFQKIRERYEHSWWLPPFFATIAAAIIDTYLFYSLAFYSSSDDFMAENWLSIAHNDLFLKLIISLVVFLPIYGLLLSYIVKKVRQ